MVPEEIFELAEKLFGLLTPHDDEPGPEWEWAQERTARALQAITDCTPQQAEFYVFAVICGEKEWLLELP